MCVCSGSWWPPTQLVTSCHLAVLVSRGGGGRGGHHMHWVTALLWSHVYHVRERLAVIVLGKSRSPPVTRSQIHWIGHLTHLHLVCWLSLTTWNIILIHCNIWSNDEEEKHHFDHIFLYILPCYQGGICVRLLDYMCMLQMWHINSINCNALLIGCSSRAHR